MRGGDGYPPAMADELSEQYGGLLRGSYDCVDRIVLNAYHPLCYSPGGFRSWWRRLHGGSEERLDNAHLMRMAGRFSRRVRGFARAHGIPVTGCGRGERKHQLAEAYLAAHPVGQGVFLLKKLRGSTWSSNRARHGATTPHPMPCAPSPPCWCCATRSSRRSSPVSASPDSAANPRPGPAPTGTTKPSASR